MKILINPNKFTKKIISLFFSCAVFVGSIAPVLFSYPEEAYAVWPVIDEAVLGELTTLNTTETTSGTTLGNILGGTGKLIRIDSVGWVETLLRWAKDYVLQFQSHWKEWVLDTIAWILAKVVIRSLTYSLVNWINSGFEGEPMFILDRTVLFALIIDRNVALILATVANFEQMPDILKSILVRGIINGIYTPFHDLLTPTFPGGKDGYAAYLRDPRQCRSTNSWECYISLSSPENNPFGLIRAVAAQLQRIITDKVADVTNDIIEGSGFMTFTECAEKHTAATDPAAYYRPDGDESVGPNDIKVGNRILTVDNPSCKRQQRVTPGTAAASSLKDAFGTQWASLVVADEIGESIDAILGALLNQFMQKGLLFLTKGVGVESFGSLGAVITPNSYLGASEDGYCNPDFISIDPDCDEDKYELWCYDYKTGPTAKTKKECRGTEEACNAKRDDFVDWCFTFKSPPSSSTVLENCRPIKPQCEELEDQFKVERLPVEEGETEGKLKNEIVRECFARRDTSFAPQTIIENLEEHPEIGCTQQPISRGLDVPKSVGDWCFLYSPPNGGVQQELCQITKGECEREHAEVVDKEVTALKCEEFRVTVQSPYCFSYKSPTPDDTERCQDSRTRNDNPLLCNEPERESCRNIDTDCKDAQENAEKAGFDIIKECAIKVPPTNPPGEKWCISLVVSFNGPEGEISTTQTQCFSDKERCEEREREANSSSTDNTSAIGTCFEQT